VASVDFIVIIVVVVVGVSAVVKSNAFVQRRRRKLHEYKRSCKQWIYKTQQL